MVSGVSAVMRRYAMVGGRILLPALLGWLASGNVVAQTDANFPSKPIRWIVPFAPGSTDLLARVIGQKASETLGQPLVIETRPGAGGSIGTGYVAKSAADGYTLLMGTIATHGINSGLYPKLPYPPGRDFAPIIQYAMVPNMLVTHPSLPVKSVKDLIALAKAKPGQVNYASSGAGSASHLAVEYFKLLAKIDITAIAYRGTGPMTVSLISGETSLTITGVPPLMPHVQAGRMRGIAVASSQRIKVLPDLPTIAEAGVAGYESTTWFGPLAPAKTPREIVTKLNGELNKVLQMPDVGKRFAAEGIEAVACAMEVAREAEEAE
jgi:tripartite-type tricarboxylate transporter receptor subunit TctC